MPSTATTRPPTRPQVERFASHAVAPRINPAALVATSSTGPLHHPRRMGVLGGVHAGSSRNVRPSVMFSCQKLHITVGGCAAFYSAVLSCAPEHPVTISPSNLPTSIRVTPSLQIFTKENWATPQWFRVAAISSAAFDDTTGTSGSGSGGGGGAGGGLTKDDRRFLQIIEHFSSSMDARFNGNRMLYLPATIIVHVSPRDGTGVCTTGRALATARQVGKSVAHHTHHEFIALDTLELDVRGTNGASGVGTLVAKSAMMSVHGSAAAAAVAAIEAANSATHALTKRMMTRRHLLASVSDGGSSGVSHLGSGGSTRTGGTTGSTLHLLDGLFHSLSKDTHVLIKVVCRKNQTVLLQRNGQMVVLGKRDVETSGSHAPSHGHSLSTSPRAHQQHHPQWTQSEDLEEDSASDAALSNMVTDIEAGDDHIVAITEQGYVLSWGEGRDGRLGNGSESSRRMPRLIKSLMHKRIIQVACGARHTFALAEDGDVYSWGYGKAGALGHGMSPQSRPALDSVACPMEVLTLKQKGVVKIACGDMHTAVVLVNGTLLTCGWADQGRLGRLTSSQTKDEYSSCFTPVDMKGKLCTYVACGGAHTLVLTECKSIYAFGSNASGQLGLGDCRCRTTPTRIAYFSSDHAVVTTISAGKLHSAAITQDTRVFAWGSDEFGQCGVGSFPQIYTVPHLVTSLVGLGVTQIAGGDGHSVVLCQGSQKHLDALETNHPTKYAALMEQFEEYVKEDKSRRVSVLAVAKQKQEEHEAVVRKRKPPVDPTRRGLVGSAQWQAKLEEAIASASAMVVGTYEVTTPSDRGNNEVRPQTAGAVLLSSRPRSGVLRPKSGLNRAAISQSASASEQPHITHKEPKKVRCSSAALWRQTRLFTFTPPTPEQTGPRVNVAGKPEVSSVMSSHLKLTSHAKQSLGRIFNDDEDGERGYTKTLEPVVGNHDESHVSTVAQFASTRPKSAPSRAVRAV